MKNCSLPTASRCPGRAFKVPPKMFGARYPGVAPISALAFVLAVSLGFPLATGTLSTGMLYGQPPTTTSDSPVVVASANSADRFTTVTLPLSGREAGPQNPMPAILPLTSVTSRLCSASQDLPAWDVPGWPDYERLWRELADQPMDSTLRAYLGLPIGKAALTSNVVIKSGRGRSAPKWLGWRSGTYRQIETPHLQIFSHASEQATVDVAQDMERLYWVWTQLFFPLWEGRRQVALHLKDCTLDKPVRETLADGRARLSTRKKLRIVLLKDAADYARTLGQSTPGIAQSTGFYSDERRTSFFYPSDAIDAVASRRHELVHQLFREATDCDLGGDSPGTDSDFWLVEGIAGYCESLQLNGSRAALGGWDSPRLQFARYRVFGGRDLIGLDELRPEGQSKVQRRADLARWYAFAIAHTHSLLDGGSVANRRWVYQQLAKVYRIRLDAPAIRQPVEPDLSLVGLLRIDDQTLKTNPTGRPLEELCLVGTQVTGKGLRAIGQAPRLRWLDLSGLPIRTQDIEGLVPTPRQIQQLSLEASAVDDSLASWIAKANTLVELDLSQTACGDATVNALLGKRQLRTLWLTGSKIGDQSINVLTRLPSIESIDLQGTGVTSKGLSRLKTAHPDWKINPLQ